MARCQLLAEDTTRVLRRRFAETPAFEIPFSQSHPDNDNVGELQRDFPDAFCEVSRVIVDSKYRGHGISKLLLRYAMTVARWMGMRRIFLECLPTHRRLYEQFRFRVVPNRRNQVYNVNKTMELMEWSDPPTPAPVSQQGPSKSELMRLLRQGYLCLCRHTDRPGGNPWYFLYGTELCPLTSASPRTDDCHLLRQWDTMEGH